MADIKERKIRRLMRHARVRKKVSGTVEKPRLVIYKSLKHLYVQVVDDSKGETITGLSTLNPVLRDKVTGRKKSEIAIELAKAVCAKLRDHSISAVVFDRNGYLYHGTVKAFAEAVREEKLLA